ncbi:hypothetical protein DPMN_075140 [Dreissena polymorpha]|uniref:DUF7869 domain-containing protein n=1 Tax=Dreissena polymorpha TaxID=45954 RepID=A0A9D3YGH9_DREPO|nr:hypothetical protein DPMN_075140 [Dreissena polymorpha]
MISRTLGSKDAEIFEDLLKILQSAERVTKIFDVKKWLQPNLNVAQHATQPLHYKFINVEGIVKFFYKGYQHQPWTPLVGHFLQKVPEGVPEIVAPDFSKIEIEIFFQNIDAIRLLLKQENYKKWKDFYETLMVNEDASEFPLPLLPKQPIETAIPKGAGLVPEVRELLEKENRQPLVSILK